MPYLGNQITTVFPTSISVDSASVSDDLTVDTSTLKVDSTNNRVGIGTTSPSSTLTVDGATAFSTLELASTSGSATSAFMGVTTSSDLAVKVNGSERFRISADGHVTMPSQPAFLVRTGTGGNATNVPINGTTIVNFGTEVFDRGADFSTNTFTAPVTGLYQINFSGVLSQMDTASTYVEVIIQCSNRSFNWTIDPDIFDQDAVYFPVNISCLADMDASDVAKIGITLPNDGTAQMDLVNYAYFSGYLVA